MTQTTLRRRREAIYAIGRDFDPRMLSNLEVWLADFTIPGTPGNSLVTGQNWLGAPPLGDLPGSLADGIWSANPGSKAYPITSGTVTGPLWSDPWFGPSRGLAVDNEINLALVDKGTETDRTVTIEGPLTFLTLVRNVDTSTFPLFDDGDDGSTGALGITTDRVQADTSSTALSDVADDDIPGFNEPERVNLVLATRDDGNVWRCWVDGVQVEGTRTKAGSLTLRSVLPSTLSPGFRIHVSNVLLYLADHSASAAALNRYFQAQHGTP